MILWIFIFLILTVNAANYKLKYTNNEWVQSAGGKGQYITIGKEPTVIQWVLPPQKTLTISDTVEFSSFGTTSGDSEMVYIFVFPESSGPDLQVLTNGVDAITLYRQNNPPVVSPIAATCQNDPGYLQSYKKWKRKFSRIRGRKLLSLPINDKAIQLNTNLWGEPHFNEDEYHINHFSDSELHLNLEHASSLSEHILKSPDGDSIKLKTGEINIITPPFKIGDYTIETPTIWYNNYEKPIIQVKRRLENWGHTHKKVKLKGTGSAEVWADVCPYQTSATYVYIDSPRTGKWAVNEACDGTMLGSALTVQNKAECINRCLHTTDCTCITWMPYETDKCRLEDSDTSSNRVGGSDCPGDGTSFCIEKNANGVLEQVNPLRRNDMSVSETECAQYASDNSWTYNGGYNNCINPRGCFAHDSGGVTYIYFNNCNSGYVDGQYEAYLFPLPTIVDTNDDNRFLAAKACTSGWQGDIAGSNSVCDDVGNVDCSRMASEYSCSTDAPKITTCGTTYTMTASCKYNVCKQIDDCSEQDDDCTCGNDQVVTSTFSFTTAACPLNCQGSFGSWNSCYHVDGVNGGRKHQTYSITQEATTVTPSTPYGFRYQAVCQGGTHLKVINGGGASKTTAVKVQECYQACIDNFSGTLTGFYVMIDDYRDNNGVYEGRCYCQDTNLNQCTKNPEFTYRTYEILPTQTGRSDTCAHADGAIGNLIDCFNTLPSLGTMTKDGGLDSQNRPTSQVTITFTTAQIDTVTCAALANDATASVHTVTTADNKASVTTQANVAASVTITGLSDETNYDFYCNIAGALTNKIDAATPDWFDSTSNAAISNLDATTVQVSAAWTDSAAARCVAIDINAPDVVSIELNPNYNVVLLNRCESDCDSDANCASGLTCFQRGNSDSPIPGCKNRGHYNWDYCIRSPNDAYSVPCTWADIENLETKPTAPASLTTADLQTSTWAFTDLYPATQYKACCYARHDDGLDIETAGSSITFYTLGFYEDVAINSKTQTSITFTFKVYRFEDVTCKVYTLAQWNAGKIQNTASTTYSIATEVNQKTFSGLNHYTQYYIECNHGTDTSSAYETTNPPVFVTQPYVHTKTTTGLVIKTKIDRNEKIVCSAYTAGTTEPMEAAIVGGTGAAATSGQVDISANTEKNIQLTGLTAGITYDIYCALVGNTDTGGAHTKSTKLTTATVSPSITVAPSASDITFQSFKITTTYSNTGWAKCVVMPADATAPTASDLANNPVAGQIAMHESEATGGTPHVTLTLTVSGHSAYDVYCGQTGFNIISDALRVTLVTPTISQPLVLIEGTDRIKISVTFSHENQASCVLVPRDAAAPTVQHISDGQGSVQFNTVNAHITFTPSCVGGKVNTKCDTPQATIVWFGGSDGTEPAVNEGKLEDDQLYDAYCGQLTTGIVSNKKQVVTVKETVTSALTMSSILFDRGTFVTTYSDSGIARCIIDYTHAEVATITQILAGQKRDGTAASGDTGDITVTGGVAISKTFQNLIDCVTYDIMCAHDDKVDNVYNGIFHETDFKTSCKSIASATALNSGYTMENNPTHQIKLPLTAWETFTVTVTFDHTDTAKCIILLKDATTPTLTQIFAGTDGNNVAAVGVGVQSTANANTAFTTTFAGLSSDTEYDVYCAQGTEIIPQQERSSLVSKLLVKTVIKKITEYLSIADSYQSSNNQLTGPADAWEKVSLKVKFSHTDPVQCLLTVVGSTAPTLDQIFAKTGATGTAADLNTAVSGEFGSYTSPDQSTATGGQYYVQEFTGLQEGHSYKAYCAQAKLDDRKNLVSSLLFTTLPKTITAALALSTDNPTTGCPVGFDAGCTDPTKQIKLPLTATDTVSVTITYSHAGKVRCAAIIAGRIIPTTKEVQNGLTLQDYESSPVQVDNTAAQQVKITFTGLKEGTSYDFICVQDFYDTALYGQTLRNTKLTMRTVPKVFQIEPTVTELGVYGVEFKFKPSHSGDGRCVIVPGANVASYTTCLNGDGILFSDTETFTGETEKVIRKETGLEENTQYKIFCCQQTERTLLSQGTTFTTKEAVRITQDLQLTKITGTTATLAVSFTDYINTACLVRATSTTDPTDTEIQNGNTNSNNPVNLYVRDVSDTFFIQDNGELQNWIMDSEINPIITLTQYETYTFVRVTAGNNMRIVAEADCTGCNMGTYTSIPNTGVIDDIELGKYQRWTPSVAGTYYYVSVTQSRMVGMIVVGHGQQQAAANALDTCEYDFVTDMPWNQTIPTKKTGCVQPETMIWISAYENITMMNPWREKPIGQASVDVVAYPPKTSYNTYNKHENEESAGKTLDITGLTSNTKYQAVCGTTGQSGLFVRSSMIEFRTLKPAASVTVSVGDSRDMATITTQKEKSDGTKYSYLPQPLGEVVLTDNEALYIVFTTDGSEPDCSQETGIIPSSTGKTSRIKNLETLKYKSCSEMDGDASESILFEMACYTDWNNLDEAWSPNEALWPKYTSVPAWMPRLDSGKPMKCIFTNPYTGLLQTPCEDGGHYFSVEFKNQTCTATIFDEGMLNDKNCDDGGNPSDYSDCPLGTDFDTGEGGCPARNVAGFCDNSCKIRCLPCPRVPNPLPFCKHNDDGTQKNWECPDINQNRNLTSGMCDDGCPPVCNVCPGTAVLTENLETCGITGFIYDVGYTSLTNQPCPEGDPNNPDAPIYEIDYIEKKCENTCTFANDGQCDEPEGKNNCADGTDCADCGESTIANKFCPSGCLPKCTACERRPIPPNVCEPRAKSCPANRATEYTFYNIKTPPACPDECFPECFECPPYIEEEDFALCDGSEGKVTPCGLFEQGNNQSCHGVFDTDNTECSKRTFCPIGCPTNCYNCPGIDTTATEVPKCRQLPLDKITTGCVKERTLDTTNRYCTDASDYPCYDIDAVIALDPDDETDAETIRTTELAGWNKQKCEDGCSVTCKTCPPLPDPLLSCSEDKLGELVIKCADLSPASTHKCYENSSKSSDCLYGTAPVCEDGCAYICKPCPTGVIFKKCGVYHDKPCEGGENPYSFRLDITNPDASIVVDTFETFDFMAYLSAADPIFCNDNCTVKCYECPAQPDPLPRCGKTGVACPEDPNDKPIVLDPTNPTLTICNASECPIMCEQCPTPVEPLPLCVNDATPCRDGVLPSCEDNSAGYDNLCDNGDKPICSDLCNAECDHCETLTDPLPKCGQFNTGVHVRKPCKDDSDAVNGRCTDKCKESCETCQDRANPLPMCGKNSDNTDKLQVCLDGTLGDALTPEGLCADGCATRCEKCVDLQSPLPKCGQFANGTRKRVRCEDGSDETLTADGDCVDTCLPTCDYCPSVTIPQPKCGRKPDGSQLNFECSDNLPIGENGLCSDGCAPLCIPCPDIVSQYTVCEATQDDCADESDAFCTIGGNTPAPVIWQSSQDEGVTVCSDATQPRCQDLCTPLCIKATCASCDRSKSFLKVEDFDQHVNGYPTHQIIQTNGLPIHPMEPYPTGGWPAETKITNIIEISGYDDQDFAAAPTGSCPFCTKFQLPKYPEKGTKFWQLQADIDVGISTFTGAYLYNHYHNTDDVAVSSAPQKLDYCSGYATNECVYHYHAYPSCVEGYVGNCGLIGYLYDGLPVLSTCTINNVELRSCYKLTDGQTGTKTSHYTYDSNAPNCNLDLANGYTFSQTDINWLADRGVPINAIKNFNGYAYIMTKNYPWMMPGFYGTQWGGFGCPKAYTNDWTPQGACVEISPLCVELVKRTPQECSCSPDATFCVGTGFDTAVQYYNRRPPIVSKVDFTASQAIINSLSTIQVSIQVSKPIIKDKSPLIINWEGEDAENQLMTFQYSTETTLSDGVTKQYIYKIEASQLINKPEYGTKTLKINSGSGVEDDVEQRVSFTTSTTFIFENNCMPDYNAEAYNIDNCVSVGGAPVPISQCNVDCYEGGYAFTNKSVTKKCTADGNTFEFIGCSARCVAPSVSLPYKLENCDTSNGGLSEGACQLSCNAGFSQSGTLQATCPGNGQVFTFSGCNAQCSIDSTLNHPAYNLNLCPHNGGLIGDCQVSCAPNYDGTPIISCEKGGEAWDIVTGACKPVCITPTDSAYILQAPATLLNAVLNCASGYELSKNSNAILPIYSCPGPGLPFIASGCGIACNPSAFDSTVDKSGCTSNTLLTRLDECNLKCAEGYGACTGTNCQNPLPICNQAGGDMGQTLQCQPACSMPNDPDFLTKYVLTECPGPVYTTESCSLSCASGFSSNGQVTATCTLPNGVMQISNECSSACDINSVPTEYDLTNCQIPAGGRITEYECNPVCKSGYVGVAKSKCNLNTGKFSFSGCSLSNCANTNTINCDDGIGCTQDICAPNSVVYDSQYASNTAPGCFNVPKDNLCADNFGCTINKCEPGATGANNNGCTIQHDNSKCDDGIECTTEICSPFDETATSAGCVFTADNSKCNDNTVCTADTCEIGIGCKNEPIVCDDGIYCSNDSCDPVQGCVAVADNSKCVDKWPCTTDVCDLTVGDCVHIEDNSMCTDEFTCTIDKCAVGPNANAEGCTHELDNSVCDDGASCSTNICAPLSSEDATGCYTTYDNAVCDDNVACTRDTCSPTDTDRVVATGCLHKDICGDIDAACTLDLEVNEDGIVIKPYIPCVEGKTFANCETVAVTISQRKEEIAVREKTEIEQYLASIADNPPSVCNPNPCLGTNSTCEIIVNETSNATRFNCTCPEGQKGDRCEMLAVSEDTKAPAHYAFIISLTLGCVMGGFICFNFYQQWSSDAPLINIGFIKQELKNVNEKRKENAKQMGKLPKFNKDDFNLRKKLAKDYNSFKKDVNNLKTGINTNIQKAKDVNNKYGITNKLGKAKNTALKYNLARKLVTTKKDVVDKSSKLIKKKIFKIEPKERKPKTFTFGNNKVTFGKNKK